MQLVSNGAYMLHPDSYKPENGSFPALVARSWSQRARAGSRLHAGLPLGPGGEYWNRCPGAAIFGQVALVREPGGEAGRSGE